MDIIWSRINLKSSPVQAILASTVPTSGGGKATGGTITTANGMTIHTFTSNGTFTPNQSLSVNYLVVAGGGGGGSNVDQYGGGGAGDTASAGFAGGNGGSGIVIISYPT